MSNTYIEVVTRSEVGYRRVFWLRESGNPPGIRCGLVGREQVGGHTTYYIDGSAHIESKSGVLYEFDYFIPHNKDDKYYILTEASITPESFASSELQNTKNKGADKVIEIDERLLSSWVGVKPFLVREGGEQETIDGLVSSVIERGESVVSEYSVRLKYMSNFFLVVLVVCDA